METIKDDARLLQQLAIVSQRFAQSVHDRIKTRSFKTVELVILQIYVMNNLGNLPQTFAIAQAESFQHRFEGAIISMMGELRAIHVEGNRAFNGLPLDNKIKTRSLIDELFDQPSGSEPVDMQVAPSHPTTTLIVRQVQRS